MSEYESLTYEALLTLSIPSAGKSISVTIKLSPTDIVPVSGTAKPLKECTLADLQGYADELEKEVWETYNAISLLALDADETVVVEVTKLDEGKELLDGWGDRLILIEDRTQRDDDPQDMEMSDSIEADEADPASDPDGSTPVEEISSEAVVSESPTADESIISTEVSVAKTESLFPDIDEDDIEIADSVNVARPPMPAIIPSKARVRVAGSQLPIGHPTWAAVDILIDEPALRQAQAHALSSLHREVAGVLIGPRPEKQPDGRYLVHIIDTIVAKHTVMHGASVTYTPESWRYLNDTLGKRYPDDTAVMAGWYHTHPGFGIFLSGMDQFIHQNFFTQIWHVAMVLDPRAKTSGFFCWDRQKRAVNRCDFSWPQWSASSW